MTDLVAAIRAAIDENERIAQAATAGPWKVDSEVFAETIYGNDDMTAVVAGGRWGGEASVFDSTADAIHIARHDPAAVLRRCAADRKILDLHSPSEYRISHGGIPRTVLQCEHCSELCHSRSGLACDDPVDAVYPCETIKLFAEAYGVEV